jgi:uncharacterized SAM-binding protein YcdF (DUF218 family)
VLSEEAVKALFVRDEPEPADLCIVLGHHDPETSARRVRHAARLYAVRFVPRLLVTGGLTAPGRPAEAELMAAAAVAAGVPSGSILVEPLARTTMENVARAAALLRERGLLGPLSTVILVSCAYHMARARLLARTAFPAGVRFLACPHGEGVTADGWQQSAEGRTCVASELILYHGVVRARGRGKG